MPPGPPNPLEKTLPILERRDEIARLIASHQVVVVCGETGSGKSTQLPQMCLDMGLAERGMIAHTQPRRLAARAVAARIAEERNVPLGGLVGVKVRFHEQTSRSTRIKVVTDGMLLAELAGDRDLKAYSTIIIDEAHERSMNIDFLIGYLKTLLPRRRDLKLIITSATIDPKRFSEYFGGPSVAPVVEVSGRMYPVEVRYAAPSRDDEDADRLNVEHLADAVEDLAGRGGDANAKDMLVFLPGEREIRLAADAITRRRAKLEVLPLFSRLSNAEQDRIFHPDPRGQQRVILATNIAETSLTVPGIRYVVDSGLVRLSRYDPARKVQRLPIEPISKASANQRAGRCGRVQAGVCVRLYSERSFAERAMFTDPEIRRTNLASVILSMLTLGLGAIEDFQFPERPSEQAIADGYHTLFEIGAIDVASRDGVLTDVGRAIAGMPVDPRIARMLLGAQREGCVAEVLVLAAALSIQDPRERPSARQEAADSAHQVFRDPHSDFVTLLNIFDQFEHAAETMGTGALFGWCRDHFLSPARMREWGEMHHQLRQTARELEMDVDHAGKRAKLDSVHRALLTGLISNVACREGEGPQAFEYRGVRGNVVQIFPGSALFKARPRWIMAAELVQTTKLYARTVAKIEPEWVEELAGHMFQRQLSDAHLDAETGVPSAFERVSMSGIVVVPRRRVDLARTDRSQARRIFVTEALAKGRWALNRPFMWANRSMLARAGDAEDRLRQRNLSRPEAEIAAWFAARLPEDVHDPSTLLVWLDAEPSRDEALRLSIDDVLPPAGVKAYDESLFPSEIRLPSGVELPVSYALAPGKEVDGVTVSVPLLRLDELSDERIEWLVPGMLGELVLILLRLLPKDRRGAIESKGELAAIAQDVADVLAFGDGALGAALSDAIETLYGVSVPLAAWSTKGLPAHLRMRVRVIDDAEQHVATDRDVVGLKGRLKSRIAAAKAAAAKSAFAQTGLTAWTFGEPPRQVETEQDAGSAAFPAIVDDGNAVSLTLAASAEEADAATHKGVRRLFALAVMDELTYLIDALPAWSEMTRQYSAFGSAESLRSDLACVIAERVFLTGQADVRSRDAFMQRLDEQRGRLIMATREVGEMVAAVLERRAKVAHRLASGTPRLWATSIADIREHATYLLPPRFLLDAPAEHLQRYPVYVESMRERLFALREEGSKTESAALAAFLPHWKKFTAWVAAAMSREKAELAEAGAPAGSSAGAARGKSTKVKAPLPQTRRTGAIVNLDAGAWAMTGGVRGVLPPSVEAYRWALEELRVSLFVPQLAGRNAMTIAEVERLWKKVEAEASVSR